MENSPRNYWKIGTIVLAVLMALAFPTAIFLRLQYPIEIFHGVSGFIALLLLCLMMLVFYLLPYIVAYHNNPLRFSAIFILNTFLGFTYVGWVISLALAFWKPYVGDTKYKS